MAPLNETVQKNTRIKEERDLRHGAENTSVSSVRRHAEKLFGGQCSDLVKLLMLGSAGLSAVFGEPRHAAAVMVLVTAEAAAGLLREHSCIKASERIARAAESRISLRTDDGLRTIPAGELREGDIFEISEGGIFPCDSVIIEQQELTCDESVLTGSRSPAEKTACAGEELRDRLGLRYIGYSGTVVLSGHAVCKAAGHGSEAFRREQAERERPSLLVTGSRRKAERLFTIFCAAASAVIAGTGMLRGLGVTQSISLGLAAAAVCIPERLTAAAELSSVRIRRYLLRGGVTVKDTAALERLGDTELLLADLRGTVTDRARSVRRVYIPADGGGGYDYSELTGRLTFGRDKDGFMAWESSALGEMMICAAVCCKARRSRRSGDSARNRRSFYDGDSDDAAILALCSACGIDRELLLLNKLGERLNDPAPHCISVTCRVLGGERRIYTKGTPEAVFGICSGVYGSDGGEALAEAARSSARMSEEGLAVTAFCETVGGRTLLLGLAGLYSPVPAETTEAVRTMRRMGVRWVLFSEDERSSAKAAALSAGILTDGKRCCTGSELDDMTDEQYEAVSGAVTVFAQSEARHKARIADISESMKLHCAASVSSTEEAELLSGKKALLFACESLPDCVKQSAEVIVPQSRPDCLAGAVRCGKALYGALRGRACAGTELAAAVLTMLLAAMLIGIKPPILPVQLLLASVLSAPASAEMLAVVPARGRLFGGRTRGDDRLIGRRLFSAHFLRGFMTAFVLLGCFTVLLRSGSLSMARTGVTAALTLSRLFSAARISGSGKLPFRAAAGVLLSAGALAAAVSLPFCAEVFGFAPLTPFAVGITLLAAVIPCCIPIRDK